MKSHTSRFTRAFSLIELLVVMVIASTVCLLGLAIGKGQTGDKRRVAIHQLMGMIEESRSLAICKHRPVILAVAEPGDLKSRSAQYHVAIMELSEWPIDWGVEVMAEMIGNWRPLGEGVVLMEGEIRNSINLMNQPERKVFLIREPSTAYSLHVMGFDQYGNIYSEGEDLDVAVVVSEGRFVNGKAESLVSHKDKTTQGSEVKVHHKTARAYRNDEL